MPQYIKTQNTAPDQAGPHSTVSYHIVDCFLPENPLKSKEISEGCSNVYILHENKFHIGYDLYKRVMLLEPRNR